MKEQHTPGPWAVQVSSERYGIAVVGPSPDPVDYELKWLVCRTASEHQCDAANARLIAAAPEMLAALMAVVSDVEVEQGADVSDDAMSLVRAAIAKAEGGTQ